MTSKTCDCNQGRLPCTCKPLVCFGPVETAPINVSTAHLAATLQAAGYRVLLVDPGARFDALSAGFDIEDGHSRLRGPECLTRDSYGRLPSRRLSIDELVESCIFDFPIRPVEPWQGKPTIHQEKPQQPVSDNLLKLLARAHK